MNLWLKFPILLCVAAIAASGQSVALSGFSPNPAQPVTALVSVTASGLPSVTGAETILPTAVTIMVTPSAGNGSPVTVPAVSIAKVIGTTWKVTFRIPAELTPASPFTATVGIMGTTTTGREFSGSSAVNALEIDPPAIITKVSPGSAVRGSGVALTITGLYTHFLQGSVSLSLGTGVTCSTPAVFSQVSLTANCTIDPGAVPGLRDVTATTGTGVMPEVATAPGAFLVSAQPTILLSPASAAQGQTVDVAVTGSFTNFVQGTTIATFGAGITVNTVTVQSPTQAVANITVQVAAALGARNVTFTTGTEVATLVNGFTVVSGRPAITSINPPFGKKGETVTVEVAGTFLLGATFAMQTVDPGDDSTPATVTVVSNTGTLATLTLVLGSMEGEFPLIATTAAGSSAITPASEFLIIPSINAASFYASVLNTIYNSPLRPLPAGQNTLTSTYVSVLNNTFSSPLSPLPAGQNAAASAFASVLNTRSSGNTVVANFASGLSVAVCNRNSGCAAIAPATISAEALPATSTAPISGLAASNNSVPDFGSLETLASVTAGQTVRLDAQNVDENSTVDFRVNQVSLATVRQAPYEMLFTVPEGMPELTFQIIVTGTDGAERLSRITRMVVAPDTGALVSGQIVPAKAGVTVELAAAALKAEFFRLPAPITALPEIDTLEPERIAYVTAINQPNPQAIFGLDPLGAQIRSDYAVRFTGEFWADTPGTYRFWLAAHSGASLAIDDKPEAQTSFAAGDAAEASAAVAVDRGWHRIAVIYYDAVGAASVKLEWQQPGVPGRGVLGPEFLRTALAGVSAISGADGSFVFPRVPLKLDTVWPRVNSGGVSTEYPGVKPGTDSILLPVRE